MKKNPLKFSKYSLVLIVGGIVWGLVITGLPSSVWAYTQDECIQCHQSGSKESTRQISMETFNASVHGEETGCQDCHTGVTDESHTSTPGSGAADCSACHDQVNRHGLHSERTPPDCYACHTKHNILSKDDVRSTVHADNLKETCKSCHAQRSGNTDYFSWLPSLQVSSHEKQDFSRDYSADNCVGCHQGKAVHGEEAVVNDQDCYKCHVSLNGENLLYGYIHPNADDKEQPDTFIAASAYQLSLIALVWGGLGFFIRKFSRKKQ
jgi:hypothetical protein